MKKIELKEKHLSEIKKSSTDVVSELSKIAAAIATSPEFAGKHPKKIVVEVNHSGESTPSGVHSRQTVIKEVHVKLTMDDGSHACFDDPPGECTLC